MLVFFLKRFVLLASIFRVFLPTAIRKSKEYLETQYKAVLNLNSDDPRRRYELNRLALLRQKINPPTEKFLVEIQVEGISMRANLCQQYCGDIYYGIGFESSELSLVRQFVEEGDIFLDVGANIGVYTLLASQLVGESGYVHSFEPLPEANELLLANIRLNRRSNIAMIPAAVGEETGETQIYINAQNALSSLGNTNRGRILRSQTVPILTLDSYAKSAGIARANFLKIDVEGFEGHVLRGAVNLVENSSDLIIMSELAHKNFSPLGFSVKDVLDWMRARGFEVWMIGNHGLILYPAPEGMHEFPFQNFLFVRPINPRYRLIRKYSAAFQTAM